MNHARLLSIAAFVGFLGLPAAVHAQGTSNYGIFGGGTSLNGGAGSSIGSSGQQGLGNPAVGSFGRSSQTALGGNPVSPYLNLLRPGSSTAVNYFALVRPQIRQDSINNQVGASMLQTDRLLTDQQLRVRPQTIDPNAAYADAMQASRAPERTAAPAASAEPRQRSSSSSDTGSRDWAGGSKDQDFTGVPQNMDSKERAAAVRRGRELKALEDELSAGDNNSPSTNTQPARPAAQGYYAPVNPNLLRPANHYFPAATQMNHPTGAQANHTGAPRQ